MSLRLKFNLVIGLASLIGILISGFFAHLLLHQHAREEVLDSARIMLESARAVRGYTESEIRPLLAQQQRRKFLPQTVPAYSARKYIDKLQEHYPDYRYKEAVLNPTNRVNLAREWEVDIVDWFRDSPGETELIGERDTATGRVLYLTHPIQITAPTCLKCHSTPDNAPDTMIAKYGTRNGFGWQLNEVVGAQVVSVPMSLPLARADKEFRIFMASLIGVFLLIGILLNIMLQVSVIKPVCKMAETADRVSMGALDAAELEIKGKDEISSLAQSFNRMHRSLTNAMKMLD